jgi:hypothetical protein
MRHETPQPLATGPWDMWAHRETGKEGKLRYSHFGTRKWVALHGLASPIVPVRLTVDPEGAYWGWMDTESHAEEPTLIWGAQLLFEICFAGGPVATQQALANRGHEGRIVRLSLEERPLPET